MVAGAGVNEGPVVDDILRVVSSAEATCGAYLERACADGGRASVGIVAGERERAGADLGQGDRACDGGRRGGCVGYRDAIVLDGAAEGRGRIARTQGERRGVGAAVLHREVAAAGNRGQGLRLPVQIEVGVVQRERGGGRQSVGGTEVEHGLAGVTELSRRGSGDGGGTRVVVGGTHDQVATTDTAWL